MTLRLREADCLQTPFIEANGDLRAQRVHRCESISGNPAEPVLRIMLAAQGSQIRPSKRCLLPGHQSREAIQYP
jgi:hypothetical protein